MFPDPKHAPMKTGSVANTTFCSVLLHCLKCGIANQSLQFPCRWSWPGRHRPETTLYVKWSTTFHIQENNYSLSHCFFGQHQKLLNYAIFAWNLLGNMSHCHYTFFSATAFVIWEWDWCCLSPLYACSDLWCLKSEPLSLGDQRYWYMCVCMRVHLVPMRTQPYLVSCQISWNR